MPYKRLVAATAALLLSAGAAWADVPCAVTYGFINGTLIDPNQVNSNFASVTGCDNTSRAGLTANRIVAYPPPGFVFGSANPFTFALPNGLQLSTAGTVTSGLAEALALMNTNGLSLDAYGNGGAISNGYFAIGGSVGNGLPLPTLRNQYVALHGSGIYGIGTGTNVVKVGSMVEGDFLNQAGQVGMGSLSANYSGATVLLNPTSILPLEGFIGIASSTLRLGNLSREGDGTATLEASVGTGNIINSTIEAIEVNGAGSGTTPKSINCFQIDSPSAVTGFMFNTVHLTDVHLCKTAAVQLGTSATNAANLRGNTYFFDRLHPTQTGTTQIALDTWASYDTIVANADNDSSGGNLAACAVLQASATHNKIKLDCIDLGGSGNAVGVQLNAGADYNYIDLHSSGTLTTPFTDNSGGHNTYRLNGAVIQEFKNGGQYNYQTPTSVSAGAGATFVSGSTNSAGSVNIGGAGAQTTVTINFSITFLNNVSCEQPSFNQATTSFYVSASSASSVTFTASAGMPAASIVSYQCHGGA